MAISGLPYGCWKMREGLGVVEFNDNMPSTLSISWNYSQQTPHTLPVMVRYVCRLFKVIFMLYIYNDCPLYNIVSLFNVLSWAQHVIVPLGEEYRKRPWPDWEGFGSLSGTDTEWSIGWKIESVEMTLDESCWKLDHNLGTQAMIPTEVWSRLRKPEGRIPHFILWYGEHPLLTKVS